MIHDIRDINSSYPYIEDFTALYTEDFTSKLSGKLVLHNNTFEWLSSEEIQKAKSNGEKVIDSGNHQALSFFCYKYENLS